MGKELETSAWDRRCDSHSENARRFSLGRVSRTTSRKRTLPRFPFPGDSQYSDKSLLWGIGSRSLRVSASHRRLALFQRQLVVRSERSRTIWIGNHVQFPGFPSQTNDPFLVLRKRVRKWFATRDVAKISWRSEIRLKLRQRASPARAAANRQAER